MKTQTVKKIVLEAEPKVKFGKQNGIESYPLYGGKVVLEFEPKKHIYRVNGDVVYGVTSITNVLAKPGLIYWAANVGAETFRAMVEPGMTLDEVKIGEIERAIKYGHTEVKDKSADMGVLIHGWIHDWLKAGIAKKPLPKRPVNPEMKNAVEGLMRWATKEHRVKFLFSEQKVYSKKYQYAGTLDAEAIVDGKPAIIDFKTTNGIYPEYFLQAVAYKQAREEETGRIYSGVYVVRLSKESPEKNISPFETKFTDDFQKYFTVFRACLAIYKWQQQIKGEEIKQRLNQ